MIDIEAVRELCKAEGLSGGPWEATEVAIPTYDRTEIEVFQYNVVFERDDEGRVKRDIWEATPDEAEFMARSRELLPTLLREVESLRGDKTDLKDHVADLEPRVEMLKERLDKAEAAATALFVEHDNLTLPTEEKRLYRTRLFLDGLIHKLCKALDKPWGYWREKEKASGKDAPE